MIDAHDTSTSQRHLVFVYGTLKRGGENHGYLAGQTFLGNARTRPGFRLYHLKGYPGLVRDPADQQGVAGEVWGVTGKALATLDVFEGVPEGLYQRVPIDLQPPFDRATVTAYLYLHDVAGRPLLGDEWPI
jgi:gamma-glutamylaminecyclotransferase